MAVLKIIFLGVALVVGSMSAYAEVPEYQVKAAMLYKFALFVEWPAEAFPTSQSPFIVCVLGKDPFGAWLHQEMGETSVGEHPVEIRYPENGEVARICHMVFVSGSEQMRMKQIIAALRNTSLLIVSDVSDVREFCRQGGMICLVTEGSKIHFELNSKAATQAQLKIDSRLKRIAKSVKCGEVSGYGK